MTNNTTKNSRKASQGRGERGSTKPAKSASPTCEVAPPPKVQVIKLGVDTHQNSYSVARMLDSAVPQPAQKMTPEAFLQFVMKQKKLAPRVVVAYEAGPFGFHLQRQLTALGVECLVVVAQNWDERHKKTKTDKIDARQIVLNLDRYLAGNTRALAVVRVPSLAEEIARDLSRERDQFKKDRTRMMNRGHALLRRYGVRAGRWWEDGALEKLRPLLREQFEQEKDAEALVNALISQMGDYAEQIMHLTVRLGDLTRELEEASKRRKTRRLKGVGHLSLEKIRREVCDWKRFHNRRQVGSYTGLCPGRDESGGRSVGLSVNKCGNPRLRHALVELAWLIVRYQPDYVRLAHWKCAFEAGAKVTSGTKKKAIVSLARQLAVDLWRISTGRAKTAKLGLKLAA